MRGRSLVVRGASTADASSISRPERRPAPTASTAAPAPTRAVIGGHVPNLTAGFFSNRFCYDSEFERMSLAQDAAVGRGFIRCRATPIAGGCRLTITSAHARDRDTLTLMLQGEVLDRRSNQHRTITLSVLTKDLAPTEPAFHREITFDLHYADIEEYLQAQNPALKLNPGTTELAVAAKFQGGHQAGGFGRGGTFRLPRPLGPERQSAISVRAAALDRVGNESALPLDMQVNYPPALVRAIPQFKKGGSIRTRLESELKGACSQEAMDEAIQRAYHLASLEAAGDRSSLERILGKDWSIQPVRRYWLKDDGSASQVGRPGTGPFSGFRVDEEGLPLQDPLLDRYFDDPGLAMTHSGGAIRLRSNRQAVCLNVKPGAGRRDEESGIVQRIEIGLDLRPEATAGDAARALQSISAGTWGGTIFNHAQRQVRKLDPSLVLGQALEPWIDITQDRHKFSLRNERTGVEVELSLDKVRFETLRPHHDAGGEPRRGEFFVVEAELDHLQLQSENEAEYAAVDLSAARNFNSERDQLTWLANTSSEVSMDLEPRLHELEDLEDSAFRRSGGYRAFEEVSKKLIPALFPRGIESVGQKAAHAAEQIGLTSSSDQALGENVRRFLLEAGFRWTPAVEDAVAKALKDPAERRAIQSALAQQGVAAIVDFAERALGGVQILEYDAAGLKRRVAVRLRELGYASTPAIEAMLERATASNLHPKTFESHLKNLGNQDDAEVLRDLARSLGTDPHPPPGCRAEALFTPGKRKAYRDRLENSQIDVSVLDALCDFLERAVAKGASIRRVRSLLDRLYASSQSELNQLAADIRLTDAVPILRLSLSAMIHRATDSISQRFLTVDAALADLLGRVVRGRTVVEASQWVQTLYSDPLRQIRAEAERLGVAAPEPAFDWDAFDASIADSLTKAGVLVEPGVKKFMRSCLSAGVSPYDLTRAAGFLASVSMENALKQASLPLSQDALELPEVSYDAASVIALVERTGSPEMVACLTPAALAAFVRGGLEAGLRPTDLVKYTKDVFESGSGRGQEATAELGASPLRLTFDPVQVAEQLKRSFNDAWTPAHDRYARAALPAALENRDFGIGPMLRADAKNAVGVLERGSGRPPPPGLL